MAHAKKTKGVVVIAKLDRLARNAAFLLRLQDSGVDFVCCDCPNADRFTVGILALLAQRERELISERTRHGLAAAKSKGIKLGTPTPQKAVATMVIANKTAKTEFTARMLPLVEEIRLAGVQTLQEIADCLNRRGISTRTARPGTQPRFETSFKGVDNETQILRDLQSPLPRPRHKTHRVGHDCDGIYEEDVQANWFSVSPQETLKIAAILKWVDSRLK